MSASEADADEILSCPVTLYVLLPLVQYVPLTGPFHESSMYGRTAAMPAAAGHHRGTAPPPSTLLATM